MKTLYDELARKILVLDGGLGSMIPSFALEEPDYRGDRFTDSSVHLKGCYDVLPLTRPDVIAAIHEGYLKVGADIISTDTLNANALSLADYGLSELVYEINREAAALARRLADRYTQADPSKPRFVAGSVGPTNRTASLSPDLYDPGVRLVTFGELATIYGEQIRGLVDGGADAILIETAFDTLNIKAALYALDTLCAERGVRVPAMVSGTLTDASGRLLSGQTVEALYASVRRDSVLSVGLNCSFGAAQMLPFLERIARVAACAVSVHPNAGLPNSEGVYDETPESMAEAIIPYLEQGLLNIVGGCCGTTPAHIEAIASVAARYRPRPLPQSPGKTLLSGLEELGVGEGDFLLVGDRATADDPVFAGMIRQGQYESAVYQTPSQLAEGAQMIGLCLDAEGIEGAEAMRRFLNLAMADPGIARAPWLIDSYRRSVWETALACVQGCSLASAVSLKKGDDGLLEAVGTIRRYGALPVIRLVDEAGPADSVEQKIKIAERACRLLAHIGLQPTQIVFDLLLTPLAGDENRLADCMDASIQIRKLCPGARLLARVGEMSRVLADRPELRAALHAVFLRRAVPAGLDMALMDPAQLMAYDGIDPALRSLCEAVLAGSSEALARLLAYAGPVEAELPGEPAARLEAALLRGTADASDELFESVATILGGMDRFVGEFLSGVLRRLYAAWAAHEVFLPGMIRSAQAIKRLTAWATPRIAQPQVPRGRVMLPSLQGDPLDLGKNAALLALSAGGYAIENLSGRPLAERIVNEASRTGADALVLNGTTASVREEILRIASTVRRKGLQIPLLVSGPAVPETWMRETLAPLYGGIVEYISDPAAYPGILARLIK